MATAIEYIGIARKSGGIIMGEENARAMLRSGKARLLLVASDTSPAAKRRAEGYVFGRKVPLAETPYTKAELSAISGKPGCSMAVFSDLGLAERFAAALCAEYGEPYAQLAETLGRSLERRKARKSGKRRKNA